MDIDQKGYLQTSDLRHYFQDKYCNFEEVIKFLNVGEGNTKEREDSRLTFVNFEKSLTPFSGSVKSQKMSSNLLKL